MQISIHAPHARSDWTPSDYFAKIAISIHAPHARSDWYKDDSQVVEYGFQSTLLMRGATLSMCHTSSRSMISIHAPHARSDMAHTSCTAAMA